MVPKFTLAAAIRYPHHRSGWGYALDALAPLLRTDDDGVLLDSMLETTFGKSVDAALAEGRVPYRRPWVGFLHVPPEYPGWYDQRKRFAALCAQPAWQQSLTHCRGLVVLSRWLRDQVAPQVRVPVLALTHPTAPCARTFDPSAWRAAGRPVVHVGWWLRRLLSLHELPLPRDRKLLLMPWDDAQVDKVRTTADAERRDAGAPPLDAWDVTLRPRLDPEAYDDLLTRSVVFLHLHAAVANNAIIECIVRRTPVLVNPLPSVREYLGDDYPLYYASLDEAAALASDPIRVAEAHAHLAAIDVDRFSGATFCRALGESTLYRSL